MKKRTYKISIIKLLILSNCLIMACFFSINLYFSQKSYQNALEKEIKTQQEQKLIFISDKLEQSMDAIEFLARSIANNYSIINNILNYQKNKNSYEQIVFQNNMSQNLSAVAYSLKDIVSVNILMDDPQLRTTKLNGVYNYNGYAVDKGVAEIKELSSGWLYSRENGLELLPYVDHIITYVLRIYSGVYYGDALGHLVINLDESMFYEQIKPYNQDGAEILIYDWEGNIISSTDRDVLGKNMVETEYAVYDPAFQENSEFRKNKIISIYQMKESDYSILAVQDYAQITAAVKDVQKFLVRTFFVLFFSFLVFSAFLAYKISKPILQLAKGVMGVEEGDWNKRIEVKSRIYEIRVLNKEFNYKIEKIEKLVECILVQEKEKQKRDMEILQAQINPHFLYNTLETINWMALSMKQKEISQMVVLLGTFLRLSLNKGKNVYLVRDELNHLKCYLDIQNIRCGGKISFSLEVEEEVQECRMVKLLLQPLVENAILHGFDFRKGMGKILLKAYKEGEYLCFRVEDDGCGMTEEQINSICDMESESGYGLKNVIKRIAFYYGNGCGLTIHSIPGEGTAIEIKILSDVLNSLL